MYIGLNSMVRYLLLFSIFIFNSILLKGEEFVWLNPNEKTFYKIELENGQIFNREIGKSEWRFKESYKILNKEILPISRDRNHYYVNTENKLFVFIAGVNYNIEIDFLNKTFIQHYFGKDNGIDYLSYFFEHKGEVYKLGGNGFWNIHSKLYKYSFKDNQWELIRTKGESPYGVNKHSVFFDKENNRILAIGYHVKNKNHLNNSAIFSLDLNKLDWEIKGYISNEFLRGYFNAEFTTTAKKVNNKLLLETKASEYYIFDFINNSYYQSQNNRLNPINDLEFYLSSENLETNWYLIGSNPSNIFSNSTFFYLSDNALFEGAKLKGDFIKTTNLFYLFNKYEFPFYLSIGLFSILIGLIITRKILVKKTKLDSDEFEEILKKLVLGKNEIISTELISNILNIENKSQDTIRQYRARFYKDFNEYLFKKYKIKEGLERLDDQTDKRYKSYKLKQEIIKAFKKKKK